MLIIMAYFFSKKIKMNIKFDELLKIYFIAVIDHDDTFDGDFDANFCDFIDCM